MAKCRLVLAALVTGLGSGMVFGDATFVITTDSDLNDNGGVDQFVPLPPDGVTRTLYIWGASTGIQETIREFNFDLR